MNLIDFYREEAPDLEGRYFSQIIVAPDRFWEGAHDFVQWVFPTRRASAFNPDCPVLTEHDISAWKADPVLQENLLKAYRRWLKFLGLLEQDNRVLLSSDLLPHQESIWSDFNHNYLRITRVLDCMVTLGMGEDARRFFQFLQLRFDDGLIPRDVFKYWTKAINGEIKY